MIFQVIIAVSEFKDTSDSYHHSRVISLTKDVDKSELKGWDYTNDPLFPNFPGIWKTTVYKTPTEFTIVESELVYRIGLSR